MADPGYVGSASAVNINVASLVLDWSAVGASAGNFAILVVAGTATVDLPSGWSAVAGTPTTIDGRAGRLTAFTKTLTSGDISGAATFTLTAGGDATADWDATIYVAGAAALDVAATKNEAQIPTTGTSVDAPSISPVSTNTRCVFFHGTIGETGGQQPTWTADPATTERQDRTAVSGSLRNPTLMCADQLVTASGATGTRTATASATVRRAGLTFALTAAAGGSNVTGTATADFSLAGTVAGTRTVKASAGLAGTVTATAAGKRTVKATAAASLAFGAVASGTGAGAKTGTAAAAFTLTGTASGKRTVKGSGASSWTFNAPASDGGGPLVRARMDAAVVASRTAASAVIAVRTATAAATAARTQTSGVS